MLTKPGHSKSNPILLLKNV